MNLITNSLFIRLEILEVLKGMLTLKLNNIELKIIGISISLYHFKTSPKLHQCAPIN